MEMISVSRPDDKITPWGETAAGLLPVIILSTAVCLEGTSNQSFLFPLLGYVSILLLFALPAFVIPIAWECGFPRWSSPYLGLVMLDILLISPIFFTRLFENDWGMLFLRGALGLLLLYFGYRLAMVLRRKSIRKETLPEFGWTQLFFIVHPLTPLVLMIVFDEIAVAYKAVFLLLGGLILAVGALVYLRARKLWLGLTALLVSALLALLLANSAAGMYWRTYSWE
jgi:hypothetical protein